MLHTECVWLGLALFAAFLFLLFQCIYLKYVFTYVAEYDDVHLVLMDQADEDELPRKSLALLLVTGVVGAPVAILVAVWIFHDISVWSRPVLLAVLAALWLVLNLHVTHWQHGWSSHDDDDDDDDDEHHRNEEEEEEKNPIYDDEYAFVLLAWLNMSGVAWLERLLLFVPRKMWQYAEAQ
jgi:hypothetical protein